MPRYQYLMTAPVIPGITHEMTDRFDIVFGIHFNRYQGTVGLTEDLHFKIKTDMQQWFPQITDQQINLAFAEYARLNPDDGRFLRPISHSWKDFNDLETGIAQFVKPVAFSKKYSDPGTVYALDKNVITKVISYLEGNDNIPRETKEELDSSLILDIFSQDELYYYNAGFYNQYSQRMEGVKALKELALTDFDKKIVYLYVGE